MRRRWQAIGHDDRRPRIPIERRARVERQSHVDMGEACAEVDVSHVPIAVIIDLDVWTALSEPCQRVSVGV